MGEAQPKLLEPSMRVQITVAEQYVGAVLNDLTSQKRGRVGDVESVSGGKSLVHVEVPLTELVGYSTSLRSQTKGEGAFSMEFAEYVHVGDAKQAELVQHPFML